MIQFAFHTDQGPRENLEDTGSALRVVSELPHRREAAVGLVLDGVGGACHGEVASAEGNALIGAELAALLASFSNAERPIGADAILNALCDTLARANRAILEQAADHPRLKGMATTVVCAVILADILYVAWAGDSRCYRFHHGTLDRITNDHSHAAELVERGEITAEEARNHPLSHTITRCLGQPHGFEADTRMCRLAPGDVVLLCTDGLTDVLTDHQIAGHIDTLHRGDTSLAELPVRLVRHALRADTGDNVTVLCCEYQPGITDLNRTRTGAYPVELARFLKRLAEEIDHV